MRHFFLMEGLIIGGAGIGGIKKGDILIKSMPPFQEVLIQN